MSDNAELHPSVLHVVPTLDIGGLERVVLSLCREQRRRGVDARVLVVGQATGQLAPQFRAAGIPVVFCPKGRGFSPSIVLRLHREAGASGIVHTHDLTALIYASFAKALRLGKLRLAHTQHSFKHLGWSWRYGIYERIFSRFPARLVCVSDDLRDTYRKLGRPASRLRVIPNGVEFHAAPASAGERSEAKRALAAEHRLPSSVAEKKWLLALGRLAPGKGQDGLLAAWNLVGDEAAREVALVFVGPESEPGFRERLVSLMKREARFAGMSLEPQRWLAAADAYVSGSAFEGLPMAGLEAASARLPMLVSEIPGHEVFRGWAAFFDPHDSGAAAARIEGFAREGCFGPGTGDPAALSRLEARCGVAPMAEAYLGVYAEL